MDYSLPGSSARGILQTQTLELVAIPLSRGSSWPGIEPSSLILQANSLLSEPPDSDHFFKWFIKKKKKRTEPERWWGRGRVWLVHSQFNLESNSKEVEDEDKWSRRVRAPWGQVNKLVSVWAAKAQCCRSRGGCSSEHGTQEGSDSSVAPILHLSRVAPWLVSPLHVQVCDWVRTAEQVLTVVPSGGGRNWYIQSH